jgi:hypothetical protein
MTTDRDALTTSLAACELLAFYQELAAHMA